MIHKKIQLFPGNERVTLTTYLLDDSKEYSKHLHPAIVVFPGGGYVFTSATESEPIAFAYLAAGFQAFVLDYSVIQSTSAPQIYNPLLDGSMALAYIRAHAEEWCIDPEKIAIIGFSAGAHAAGYLGTHWQEEYICEKLNIPFGSNRPNAMILSYPVITSGEYAHRGSIANLLGDKQDDPNLLQYVSHEKNVSEHTPPTYLWHTAADGVVPVENSLLFASALSAHKIPFELHVFPEGGHGLSLVTDLMTPSHYLHLQNHVGRWFDETVEWLRSTLKI